MAAEQTTQEMTDERQRYELGYHLVPTVGDDRIASEADRLKEGIERREGAIVMEEAPRLMELAYPMEYETRDGKQRFESAYFGWVLFDLTPAGLEELQEEVGKNPNILRFLIVKMEHGYTPTHQTAQSHMKTADENTETEMPESASALSDEELDKHIDELVKE